MSARPADSAPAAATVPSAADDARTPPAIDRTVKDKPRPSSTPAAKCPACGSRSVRPTARPDRTLPYRNFAAIAVPSDFPIPTCRRCQTQYIDPATAAALEPLLNKEYRAELQRRAQRAIETLSKYITQRRLEWLMDLSQGYLSRLRAGKGQPSAELVAHLSLLARDPKLRLLELERYCGDPSPPIFPTPAREGLR